MKPGKKRIVTYLQRARLSALVGALTVVPMVVIGAYLWASRGEWVLFAFGVLGAVSLVVYVKDSERHFRNDA